MTVVANHLTINMTGDLEDGFLPYPGLSQFGYQRMPVVVPATRHLGLFAHIVPSSFERRNVPRRIGWLGPAKWKELPFIFSGRELIHVPFTMSDQGIVEVRIHWNDST